jgi:preprotein translocase subunit SecA
VEAAPAPTVAPVAAPAGLAQFAAEAAAKAQDSAVATKERPAGLRAKGIEDSAPPLTYTGPSEDGSVQRSGGGGGGGKHAASTGTSRRERREAARREARATKGRRG